MTNVDPGMLGDWQSEKNPCPAENSDFGTNVARLELQGGAALRGSMEG